MNDFIKHMKNQWCDSYFKPLKWPCSNFFTVFVEFFGKPLSLSYHNTVLLYKASIYLSLDFRTKRNHLSKWFLPLGNPGIARLLPSSLWHPSSVLQKSLSSQSKGFQWESRILWSKELSIPSRSNFQWGCQLPEWKEEVFWEASCWLSWISKPARGKWQL